MVQICSKCSRANPEEASYCYFDGFVLGHGTRQGGPVAVGVQAFAQPFVFPTGRACRNFDELALACQEEWSSARDLLRQGYLEGFFGNLGRIDLAQSAKEAARFPDPDRGLDQLLAKFPSDVLVLPRLGVETREINLGVVKVGDQREFTLHLENKGMRLLYGTISCSGGQDVWLTLGDTPGTTEKHFQFGGEQAIKVKVVGDRLRANVKPLAAKLVIDSNGGQETVLVRADVPVKPFSSGVLAGSRSPRDLAMKAKQHIKEAAPCFEQGEVEVWYKENGWIYPVQGPVFSGIHAIQQFFEALGLVKPPPVAIDTQAITWSGDPGERLTWEIKVESPEKKPVYAYALSDQPWVQPEKAKLSGRTASISVVVPSVPSKPGKTLSARVTVHSNGNQRFEVPVSLAVTGNDFDFTGPGEADEEIDVELMPAVALAEVKDGPAAVMPPPLPGGAVGRISNPSHKTTAAGSTIPLWLHLIPALLLLAVVLGVVIFDLVKPLSESAYQAGGGQLKNSLVAGGEPRLILHRNIDRFGCFGIELAREQDPTNPGQKKRITYAPDGSGDNVIVKIDGREFFFNTKGQNQTHAVQESRDHRHWVLTKTFRDFDVEVKQSVELVAGATGLLDTVLVLYTISNHDKNQIHEVGLRVLHDTYIGANDGVPFTIPGQKGFLDKMREFPEKEIPDYIEAIEKPQTPSDLGTIVRMGLKNIHLAGTDLEPIDKLRICLYPGSQTKWDWDMEPMNKNPKHKDSCVALYWVVQKMNPGDKRTMGYTYGLSELSIAEGEAPMALSAPTMVRPGSEFVITAYVWKARPGARIDLELPAGLTLAENETPDKTIEEGDGRAQVSWRVKAGAAGEFPVSAKMGRSISPEIKVKVRESLF